MKVTEAIVYVLFLVGVLASTSALAGHRGGEMGGYHDAAMHERMFERMAHKLDLTDQQQQEIAAIRETTKENLSDTRGEMKAARKEIREAVQAGAGEQEIQQMLIAQSANKARVIVERARAYQAIQEVLTEEQREEFAEMRERRKARMEKRFKKYSSEQS